MAGNKDLATALNSTPGKPTIKRGAGYHLSTDLSTEPVAEEKSDNALSQLSPGTQTQNSDKVLLRKNTNAKPEPPRRVSRGYKLREDLVKACKRVALDEDRKLYEVMEDALEQYLQRHKEALAAEEGRRER